MKDFSTNGDLYLLAQQIATRFPDAYPADLGMLGWLIVDIHDPASDMYGQTLIDLARTRPKNFSALRSELVDLKAELVRL
ncbi:MAG: hypothetical protein EXR57_06770 [Dehalococcoidia bacterium]|nr:hypothetical protein [Dehalococcoidia bacterium]